MELEASLRLVIVLQNLKLPFQEDRQEVHEAQAAGTLTLFVPNLQRLAPAQTQETISSCLTGLLHFYQVFPFSKKVHIQREP